MLIRGLALTIFLGLMSFLPARADEGMWPLNNFPASEVGKLYGFTPTQEWLHHVRLSAVRLAQGCSAGFVSARGLVQTNHHCAEHCIEELSTAAKDLVQKGFYAKDEPDEVKCPNVEVNQLVSIGDVTAKVLDALTDKDGPAYAEAKRAIRAAIARECSGGDSAVRCDVVELYSGGVYNLYKYRRYQDVSYLRVYENGKPLDTAANYFRYAPHDVKPGDLTFTVGNPGSTQRQSTVAELEFARDVTLLRALLSLSELRGQLTEFSTKGPEQARIANGLLFGVENGLKAQKGRMEALIDPAVLTAKAKAENDLRSKVDADQRSKAEAGAAWDGIKSILKVWRTKRDRYSYLEGRAGFSSQLFGDALALVRLPAEKEKPDEKRLPEYTEANLPSLRQSLLADQPIYPELEKLKLTFSLTKLREVLGPDDPFVKKALGNKSPEELTKDLVDGTKLGDLSVRKTLLEGGQQAVDASNDPMIAFAQMVDPDFREVRKDYEDNIASPLNKYHSQVSRARFKIYGTSIYPDATFTLRISYGTVQGYWQNGTFIEPITRIGGLFERATGAPPPISCPRLGLSRGHL